MHTHTRARAREANCGCFQILFEQGGVAKRTETSWSSMAWILSSILMTRDSAAAPPAATPATYFRFDSSG